LVGATSAANDNGFFPIDYFWSDKELTSYLAAWIRVSVGLLKKPTARSKVAEASCSAQKFHHARASGTLSA
jgi:hypothetical protein